MSSHSNQEKATALTEQNVTIDPALAVSNSVSREIRSHDPEPDQAPATTGEGHREIKGYVWTIVVLSVLSSTFLFSLDNTIVANLQPKILEDFGNIEKLPWVSVAFSLGAVCVSLIWGKIYGEYDNKYLFLVAVFIFEIGSAVCGSAPSLNVLIVGRAICGLGGPAMAPPPGVAPDSLQESNSVFSWFIMTIVLCITLSTLAVVMRLYTKLRIIRQIGWEDYTSVLGHLMWVAYCVPTTLIMRHGGETHQWDLQLKNLIQILYYSSIGAIFYGITVFIIKLSILLQYLRIFAPSRSGLNFWSVNVMIGVNLGFYVAITLVEILSCSPREKYWNVLMTTGHCLDVNDANISAGAVNSFSDFVILLLPLSVIWRLQMPLKRKIGVSAVFLTGLFVCITSVLRLYYAVRLAQTGDISYNIALMGFWTYAELSTGVICGCLPISPKFFQAVRLKMSTSTTFTTIRAKLEKSKLSRRSVKRSDRSNTVHEWRNPYSPQGEPAHQNLLLEMDGTKSKGLNGFNALEEV